MDKGLRRYMMQKLHLLQQLYYFPLNGRRQSWEKPPSIYFCAAGSSLIATEMTQMQRKARLVLPRCNSQ
jgi:hypothetical protein